MRWSLRGRLANGAMPTNVTVHFTVLACYTVVSFYIALVLTRRRLQNSVNPDAGAPVDLCVIERTESRRSSRRHRSPSLITHHRS